MLLCLVVIYCIRTLKVSSDLFIIVTYYTNCRYKEVFCCLFINYEYVQYTYIAGTNKMS